MYNFRPMNMHAVQVSENKIVCLLNNCIGWLIQVAK